MAPTHHSYPAVDASPLDLCRLADAYRAAAVAAADAVDHAAPHATAPVRLLALHAIELYLTAFLVSRGSTGADARRLGHDLRARADLAASAGLVLRRRTVDHLAEVGRDREYLALRYGPERLPRPFHANRLVSTLGEVAAKVSAAVSTDARPAATGMPGPGD